MTEFSLDRIAGALNARGIAAEVDQTGGGTATLFAGERFFDRDGEPRWQVIAGPGYFDQHGMALADTADFSLGLDNDGASGDDVVVFFPDFDDVACEQIESLLVVLVAFKTRTFTWPDGAYQRSDGHWGERDILHDERRRVIDRVHTARRDGHVMSS